MQCCPSCCSPSTTVPLRCAAGRAPSERPTTTHHTQPEGSRQPPAARSVYVRCQRKDKRQGPATCRHAPPRAAASREPREATSPCARPSPSPSPSHARRPGRLTRPPSHPVLQHPWSTDWSRHLPTAFKRLQSVAAPAAASINHHPRWHIVPTGLSSVPPHCTLSAPIRPISASLSCQSNIARSSDM